MALSNTNITTTLVSSTLGFSSNDVGALCTANSINPYSKFKPYFLSDDSAAKRNGVIPYPTGWFVRTETVSGQTINYMDVINWTNINQLEYFDYENIQGWHPYYSIGDFRGYNHITQPYGITSDRILIQADPGRAQNVRVVLSFNGSEFAQNTILYSEQLNLLQPKKLCIGSQIYTVDQLSGATINDVIESVVNATTNVINEAPYLFSANINFNAQYTAPYFLDDYSNVIYLNRTDAINSINNTINKITVTPQLSIPNYFNNCYKSGNNYYKNSPVFRDCPIRPKVFFDGVEKTSDDFFFRNLLLKGAESYEGLPDHYAIFGDFYSSQTGFYYVEISLKLFGVDWQQQTIITPSVENTTVFDYGYNANVNDGSIPAIPLMSDDFMINIDTNNKTFSFILNQIPFVNYSAYFGDAEAGYNRVNNMGVEVTFNFISV